MWLCAPQARQIWHCLVERAIFVADREACFKWFSKLMGEEPDLDPEVNRDFFENQILQLDPSLMTESGMKCFDRFFKAVNAKEGKLVARRKMNDVGLTGLDYLWRVILFGSDPVAEKYVQSIYTLFLLFLIDDNFTSKQSYPSPKRNLHQFRPTPSEQPSRGS